jgi:hypothetical protein
LTDSERLIQFEQLMLPHMAAAYNLARWLTRQEQDASDVTQEAMVRRGCPLMAARDRAQHLLYVVAQKSIA